MSVDHNEAGEADVMLARALAQAVREVGRTLAADPRRVQGMVSDVLGAESRSRRAEIDAVVLAAEEAVPDDLMTERIDVADAMERLRERGLDATVATFAIDVWRYALGMLEADAEPPSLSNSVPNSTERLLPSTHETRVPQPPTVPVAQKAPPTVVEFAAPVAAARRVDSPLSIPLSTPPPSPVRADPHRSMKRRRWAILALTCAAVIGLGAVVVAAPWDDQTTGPVDTVATSVDTLPVETTLPTTPPTTVPLGIESVSTTTTTTTTTTVPVVVAPSLVFDVERTGFGDLTRIWTVNGAQLDATLTFTNTTATEGVADHYESIPATLAPTQDAVKAEGATVMYDNANLPVWLWSVTVPPNGMVEYTYHVTVSPDTTIEALQQFQAEQRAATEAFTAERSVPPAVDITTPDDTVVPSPEADVAGSADPAATLVVLVNGDPASGVAIPVDANGNWVAHVTNLHEKWNTITAVATSRWKVSHQDDSIINYTIPEVVTPVTPKPTKPSSPPVVVEPTPAPAAPRVTVSAPPSAQACTSFTVTASVSGQTTGGSWSTPWGSFGGTSLTIRRPGQPGNYSVTVTYTATGPGPSGVGSATIVITPNAAVTC